MTPAELVTLVLSAIGGGLALLFAAVVIRADPHGPMNRRLAALLVIDGAFFGYLASTEISAVSDRADLVIVSVLLITNAGAHLLFAGTLETPLVRALRGRAAARTVCAVAILLFLAVVGQMLTLPRGAPLPEDSFALEFTWVLMGLSSLFALVASIDAFRRTTRGTPAHRRARSFALAFGTRDAFFAVGIFGYGATQLTGRLDIQEWTPVVISGGIILFVSLLTYGILSTQLFDIDLRIKWGISRSTVVTIGIVAVLGALKTVEYSFNRTFGAIAAGLVAGIVLVLAPRLNKLGDKVANAAMPAVQPTTAYVTFKKLEVYRSAVEAAHETGGLTPKDRASLERLRAKLGLSASDAEAIEAEIVPAASI